MFQILINWEEKENFFFKILKMEKRKRMKIQFFRARGSEQGQYFSRFLEIRDSCPCLYLWTAKNQHTFASHQMSIPFLIIRPPLSSVRPVMGALLCSLHATDLQRGRVPRQPSQIWLTLAPVFGQSGTFCQPGDERMQNVCEADFVLDGGEPTKCNI